MKFNECNTYYQVAAAGLPFCHGCALRWWSIKHCWIWWLISVEGSWLEWLEQWRMGSIVPIGHCSSHSSWINGIHGRDGTNGRTGMAGLGGQIRIGRWQSQPEEWAEDTPPQPKRNRWSVTFRLWGREASSSSNQVASKVVRNEDQQLSLLLGWYSANW